MRNNTSIFEIPQIKSFIPERLKPWIMILFVLIIQCSGGVYLAAVSDMVGSTQMLQEDIMMAGYASLVGMSLYFTLMFRLKAGISPKKTLVICITTLLVCNILCIYIDNAPLLIAINLVTGFIRLWATFECNSTIQLWLTPKRDMSVFFCYVFLIANGMIQLSGTATSILSVCFSWHYMHWFVAILLLVMLITILVIYKGISIMPRTPLIGIDWLGMILWGAFALCILFVCVYGKYYDWWQSMYIRFATILGGIILCLNLLRASNMEYPFISVKTLRKPIVPLSISVVLFSNLLLAPSRIFEYILMEGFLGYDTLNIASLNWIALLGVIIGAIFTWRTFSRRKWSFQRMLIISFTSISLYLAYFYFYIDYNLPIETLYFPIFIRSVAHVIITIIMLTSLTRLPFPFNFTQGVCIHNLFSTSIVGAFGTAVTSRVFDIFTRQNFMQLSEQFDNPVLSTLHIRTCDLYGIISRQATMLSMKEVYGWWLLLSIGVVICITMRYSNIRPLKVIEPTYNIILNSIRKNIKIGLQIRKKEKT